MEIEVYHGSVEEVKLPNPSIGRSKLDFGRGFYTTTLCEQAENWATLKSAATGKPPIVSVYNFWDSDELLHKTFDGYTREWLDFVVNNRRKDYPVLNHLYDVIYGNIADDKVMQTVNNYIELLMSGRADDVQVAAVLRNLSYQKENNQYCFATAKAIKYLEFVKSYTVTK